MKFYVPDKPPGWRMQSREESDREFFARKDAEWIASEERMRKAVEELRKKWR